MNTFTTSCFIRKNTPELREKLQTLGYKQHGDFRKNDDTILVFVSSETKEPYYSSFWHIHSDTYINDNDIDCQENEELFLAIAALREDSDYMQWFVSNNGTVFNLCTKKINVYSGILCSKATVFELIERFK